MYLMVLQLIVLGIFHVFNGFNMRSYLGKEKSSIESYKSSHVSPHKSS